MNTISNIGEYLPFLIPIIIIELVLMVTALIHVLRHDNYKILNRPVWVVIVVFIQIIGPVIYFVFGRSDE